MTISFGTPIIPGLTPEQKKELKVDEISKVFSDGIPKIAYEETEHRKTPVKEITPENLNHLESVDIKEDWEKLSPSSVLRNNPNSNAIRPSRAGLETNFGGTGVFPGLRNTLGNPDIVTSIKNSEFSDHAIEAGKIRREKNENKGKNTNWEDEADLKAKTTKDVPVTASGIIPNRSAFEPAPLPKVELNITKKEQAKTIESKKAGEKAAEIKQQLDRAMAKKDLLTSDNWEEEALDKISETMSREFKIGNPINIAKQFTPVPVNRASEKKINLSGIFKTPEDPAAGQDPSLKRDSNVLKTKRQKRSDDRSWEVVVRSKKTK